DPDVGAGGDERPLVAGDPPLPHERRRISLECHARRQPDRGDGGDGPASARRLFHRRGDRASDRTLHEPFAVSRGYARLARARTADAPHRLLGPPAPDLLPPAPLPPPVLL